jgi:hypothetical protein
MRGADSDIPRKDGANLSHQTATLQLVCSNEPSRAARRAWAKATQNEYNFAEATRSCETASDASGADYRRRKAAQATRSRWRTATSTRSTTSASCEAKAMSAEITYKTHILIGVRENGVMTVIADWPHLPRQSEVQDRMNDARTAT